MSACLSPWLIILRYDNILNYENQPGWDQSMTPPRGDLLLHPIRLRVVQALINRPLTPSALNEVLSDVAPATLYRHINHLEAGGLIRVSNERRVRGGVERTFEIEHDAVALDDADLADTDTDTHFQYFATFVGTLLSDYAAYLQNGQPDLATDRVGYRQAALWLTDDEFDQLASELREAITRRMDHQTGPGRRRRLVTSIVMPDDR